MTSGAFATRRARGGARRHLSGYVGVLLGGMASTAIAADVNITSSTATGVNLNAQAGSTVEVFPGVTVTNAAFARALSGTTKAWALTNRGTISATSTQAVFLSVAGSSVLNLSTITSTGNTISLEGGGSVQNNAGATILTGQSAILIGGSAGSVNNAGTITQAAGGFADTVLLNAGGTVTNSGNITGNSGQGVVSVGQGSSRTIINSGNIINIGTGTFATGAFVQGGPSTIINSGTISGGFNGVYASSSAALTFDNSGTISSTGTRADSRAVEATGGGTLVNSGTIQSASGEGLYVNAAATVTNRGTITGAVRAINFSGSAVHTLSLDTGSVLNGTAQGGSGVDNLVLLGSGSESIARFLSFETLSMQGSAWQLTGTGAFATSAQVQSGTLDVSGTLTSPAISVLSGGTLTGNGTLVGAVGGAGRVLVSSGVLTVTGSYTTTSGSTFAVGVTPSTSGRLLVSGTANLSGGGTVSVLVGPGVYTTGTEYLILDAGTRTGAFATLVDNSAFVDFVLDYAKDPTAVWLRVGAIANLPVVAQTPNQIATAAALQALGPANPLVAALVPLSAPDALIAFDQLSGEIHAAVSGGLLGQSRLVRDTLVQRTHGLLENIHARGVWMAGYGNVGHKDGDGNAAALDFSSGGLLFGAEGGSDSGWYVGVAGGLGRSGFALPDRNSDATSTDMHMAFYGGGGWQNVRMRFGAAYTHHSIMTTRTPTFPGFVETLTARYDATTAQAFGEVGYNVDLGPVQVEPFAGLAGILETSGAYAETGGISALTGAPASNSAFVATLGVRISGEFVLGDGLKVKPYGSLAWEHMVGATATATHAFAGSPAFTVAAAPEPVDALNLQLGAAVELTENAHLDLSYSGRISGAGNAHALKATLSVSF